MIPEAPHRLTVEAIDEIRNGTPAPIRYRQASPEWHWVDLTGDYVGARAEVLVNPGIGLLAALQTTAGICEHLHELVRDWNLDDDKGQPLPLNPTGVRQLSDGLSAAIMQAWSEARELHKRPNRTR